MDTYLTAVNFGHYIYIYYTYYIYTTKSQLRLICEGLAYCAQLIICSYP